MPCRSLPFYTKNTRRTESFQFQSSEEHNRMASVHHQTLTTFRPVYMNTSYMEAVLLLSVCPLAIFCTVTFHIMLYKLESGHAESVSRDSFLPFTHSSKNSLGVVVVVVFYFFAMTPHPSHCPFFMVSCRNCATWRFNNITIEVYLTNHYWISKQMTESFGD